MPALDAGAIDEDADLVPVGEDAGDEACDVGGRGEVGSVDVRVAVEGFDGSLGGLVGSVTLKNGVSVCSSHGDYSRYVPGRRKNETT